MEVSRTVTEEYVIGYLRAHESTLTYDPRSRTLRADTPDAVTTAIGRTSYPPGAARPHAQRNADRRRQIPGQIARHWRKPMLG